MTAVVVVWPLFRNLGHLQKFPSKNCKLFNAIWPKSLAKCCRSMSYRIWRHRYPLSLVLSLLWILTYQTSAMVLLLTLEKFRRYRCSLKCKVGQDWKMLWYLSLPVVQMLYWTVQTSVESRSDPSWEPLLQMRLRLSPSHLGRNRWRTGQMTPVKCPRRFSFGNIINIINDEMNNRLLKLQM